MTTKKSNAKKSKVPVAGIAAGALAATAAAGAAYYFYGAKSAAKHRKAAAKWADDMKKDVIREAKKLQKLDAKVMSAVVDKVSAAYKGAKAVSPAAVTMAAKELKDNWRALEREFRTASKPLKSAPKRAVKKARTVAKAVKKVAKKTVAKKPVRKSK